MTAKGKKAVLQRGDAGFDASVVLPDGRIIGLGGGGGVITFLRRFGDFLKVFLKK